MKKAIYLSVLLVAIIMISGCTGIPDIFGKDVISVQQKVIANGQTDVLVIKDIMTIPKSSLLPDQQLMLSFILENRDTLKSANAKVDLFNAPTMRNSGGYLCNLYAPGPLPSMPISGYSDGSLGGTATVGDLSHPTSEEQRYCTPDQCGLEGCIILPGEEKPVNFVMRTPTEDDIKNIKTATKLDFKVTYHFDGSLDYLVPAISTEEIVKRQRSGDKTTLFTTKSYGSGPVQIDTELQGAPYMLSDPNNPALESVIFFTINNKGSGTLVKSQINNGAMTIQFPPELIVVQDKYSEKFNCLPAANGGTECTNNKISTTGQDLGAIPLYRDQSRSSLRFTVRLKDPLQEPFRSFQITSTVSYNYELRNSMEITINPFQNT